MTSPDNTPPRQPLQLRLPLLLALALAAGMFIGQRLPHYSRNFQLSSRHSGVAGVLDEILRYVDAKYVDTVDVDHLRSDAIEHLLSQLDPHSVYITPEELQAVEDDMEGSFVGVGIEFIVLDDTLQVVAPLPGGPSEAAGILAGDKIVSINDTVVAGTKIETGKFYNKLRGAKGSKVKIGVLRGKETQLRFFDVIRDVIPVKSVDIGYMLDERTGYIRVSRFNEKTYTEFMENLTRLAESNGMRDLMIDLRGNPGGYLDEATDMLSQVFPEGKLLVYTQGRSGNRIEYKSNGRARFNIEKVSVLIDEGSASASEILAGAIQDWDRGWVIGRRSFGKGLVQEQYPLSNGGAMRLTVARYYTPSGRCIQRDYKHSDHYAEDGQERLKNGELTDGSKVKQADSTKYYTGMGRIVYGGGGITPDVFVPLDSSFLHPYYSSLHQYVPQFAARWLETRDKGSLPAQLADFSKNFEPDEVMLELMADYAEKQGVAKKKAELAQCSKVLKLQIKARIAKLLFGDVGMYTVLNNNDPAVQKALETMKSEKTIGGKG